MLTVYKISLSEVNENIEDAAETKKQKDKKRRTIKSKTLIKTEKKTMAMRTIGYSLNLRRNREFPIFFKVEFLLTACMNFNRREIYLSIQHLRTLINSNLTGSVGRLILKRNVKVPRSFDNRTKT